eukprot:751014-Hanusia_phi.AAC.1
MRWRGGREVSRAVCRLLPLWWPAAGAGSARASGLPAMACPVMMTSLEACQGRPGEQKRTWRSGRQIRGAPGARAAAPLWHEPYLDVLPVVRVLEVIVEVQLANDLVVSCPRVTGRQTKIVRTFPREHRWSYLDGSGL